MAEDNHIRMKLWVDDVRDAPDESWTVVRKVQPAISLLAKFPMDEISLDHDIENRPDDETFLPIAYYIGEKYYTSRKMETQFAGSEFVGLMEGRLSTYPKITIHSINPVGAKNMFDILKSYGIDSKIEPYAPDLIRLRREYGID